MQLPRLFAHLGLAIGAGQAQAGGVVGQQYFRLDERVAINRVEASHDFARLLNHRFLVFAGRHGGGTEGRDVRSLADGVGEEAHRDAGGEAAHLYLGLHRGVALQARHGDEVHVVECQFAQFGYLRLDEYRDFLRVEPAGEVIECHLDDVLAYLFRVVRVVGQGLRVGYHDEHAVERAGVLQFHAPPERANVMPQVQFAGGAVAGEYYFSHACTKSLY